MRSKKNITSNLRNITPHFTGKEKIITLVSTIIMLSFTNITFTSALSYQSSVGVGFTFNPTLSVNISPSDLVISNLTPGTIGNSNIINVSVATNAAYGYTLSATMNGNNSNLTHTNGTNIFSSIATNADLADLDNSEDSNIWGYSYKDNAVVSPTWSNYNGLSNSDNTTLINTDSNVSSNLDFKIAAKASGAQPSGTYTGTINFTAVSNVASMSLLDSFIASDAEQLNGYFKMQDMTHDICEAVDVEESELQLIDVRDNKVYWVAKLKDGNCWMTQNLELDLIADSAILNSTNTDIDPDSYNPTTGAYSPEGGYSKDESTNIVTWSPERNTATSLYAGIFPNTDAGNSTPYSYNSGDQYYYSSKTNSDDYSYNTAQCIAQGHIDCDRYKAGNYYNWAAAIVSNSAIELTNNNSDADNSICPKSWRLPKISSNEFSNLAADYFITSDNVLSLRNKPLYFTRSGGADGSRITNPGSWGNYWSSTIRGTIFSKTLLFRADVFKPADYNFKYVGLSVRCLAR